MASLKSADRKIDVHAHFLPTWYVEELRQVGIAHPDGMGGYPEWSVESALETYDRLGIATGILSISSPGAVGRTDGGRIGLKLTTHSIGIVL